MSAIQGMDKLMAQLNRIADFDTVSASMAGATIIAKEAKVLAPVDTTELRESIEAKAEGKGALVVAGAEHAIYQEFGTSYQVGTPFLRPAVDNKGDEAVRAVGKDIERQIKAAI